MYFLIIYTHCTSGVVKLLSTIGCICRYKALYYNIIVVDLRTGYYEISDYTHAQNMTTCISVMMHSRQVLQEVANNDECYFRVHKS